MNDNRQKYYDAAKTQLEPNIFCHSLALEACMGGLYDYFKEQHLLSDNEPPREAWILAGLIHDIDFSGEFKDFHPTKTAEVLGRYGLELPEGVDKIIQAHDASKTGVNCHNKAEWSIFCADSLTGLILATAFVLPSRKLADVKLSSVVKRFLKEPRFAAGTRRDEVALCSKPEGLNLPFEKFAEICLESMRKTAGELGV